MSTSRVPIRQITHGPRHHWFGYYDKLQFSPDGRYVLGMSVNFENRKPTAQDEVRIGMVDLEDGDRWLDLGHSVSWGWQQGCMLQWRPGAAAEVMWNDRDGDHFVTRSLNIDTGIRRTWPWPFYALSPDGHRGVGVDFERIQAMRPGYGYPGVPDRNADCLRPADSGAWLLDWERDTRSMVISIEQAASVPADHPSHAAGKHYFNHLLFSPDGTRFIFLNRWRDVSTGVATGNLHTRMFTVGVDGDGLHPGRRFGQHVPLHLARSRSHPGLDPPSVPRRCLLPVSGSIGLGGGTGTGLHAGQRTLHLSARPACGTERHLSTGQPDPGTLPL